MKQLMMETIDHINEVLEIENYWARTNEKRATEQVAKLPDRTLIKIFGLSEKVSFIFRCEDTSVLKLKIYESIINSHLTIDILDNELNGNGQRLYAEGRTVDEMLKIESEKANKIYNDSLKNKS